MRCFCRHRNSAFFVTQGGKTALVDRAHGQGLQYIRKGERLSVTKPLDLVLSATKKEHRTAAVPSGIKDMHGGRWCPKRARVEPSRQRRGIDGAGGVMGVDGVGRLHTAQRRPPQGGLHFKRRLTTRTA